MRATNWREVADEVFVRSYDHLDINICVVRGGEELLVVDSRSSPAEAAELAADLKAFAPARVHVLVNTHAHFDHTFGNQQFGPDSATPLRSSGTIDCRLTWTNTSGPGWLPGVPAVGRNLTETGRSPDHPTHAAGDARQPLQIGHRTVELQPLSPGHTDTDLIVHVPDAGLDRRRRRRGLRTTHVRLRLLPALNILTNSARPPRSARGRRRRRSRPRAHGGPQLHRRPACRGRRPGPADPGS